MNRYKRIRYEAGLTISEVSRGSGVSRPTVTSLEESDKVPSAPVAKALADFYGVSVQQLVGPSDEPNGHDLVPAA